MKKRMKIFWLFLMLVSSVLLLYQQREQFDFSQFNWGSKEEEAVHKSLFSMEYSPVEENLFATYENDIIHCTKDGIKKYSITGKQIWSQPYTIIRPRLMKSEPYLAVGDIEGYDIIVLNSDGKVYEVKTQYSIVSFDINSVGYLAVVTKVEDGHRILVYDPDGNFFLERVTHIEEDGYPIGVALSPAGDKMVTNYVDTNGNEITSKITFFEISQKGEKYIDSIMGSYNYSNTFFGQIAYMENNIVVGIGDERVLAFNVSEKPDEIWSHVVSNKIDYWSLEPKEYFALVFGSPLPGKESTGEGLTVVYDLNGKKMADFNQKKDVTYLYGNHDQIIIGYGRTFYGVTTKGKKIWEYTAMKDIYQVIPFQKKAFSKTQKVLLVSKDHFEVIEIVW